LTKGTNHEAMSSTFLLLNPSQVQIFSAAPSSCILPSTSQTKFHTHTKQKENYDFAYLNVIRQVILNSDSSMMDMLQRAMNHIGQSGPRSFVSITTIRSFSFQRKAVTANQKTILCFPTMLEPFQPINVELVRILLFPKCTTVGNAYMDIKVRST
jgi:hypothetical protein